MDGRHGQPALAAVYQAPPAPAEDSPSDLFGLSQLIATVRRRWRAFLGVAAAVSLVGVAIALVRPPRYEASALLLVNPQHQQHAVNTQPQQQPLPPDPNYINSQVALLKSEAIARQLVDRLKLVYDPEWNPFFRRNPEAHRAQTVAAVSRAIDAHRQDQTDVIVISAHSKRPEMAMRLANALADTYLQWRTNARLENAARTSAWITGRLSELRNDLQQKEAAVQAYRAQSGLLTANGVPLDEQQVTNVDTSMIAARTDLAEKQARYQQLSQAMASGASSDALAGMLGPNDTIVQLRERQVDAARKLADLLQHYGDRYPAVISARAEVADIDSQIKSEVSRQAMNMRNEARVAQARMATLEANLSSARGRLASNNEALVHLNELERESTAARGVYEAFLQRLNEVEAGVESEAGDAQLVSRATLPPPLGSRPVLMSVAVAIALGLAAGVLAALIADQTRQTIDASDDIERNLALPLLTSIPLLAAPELRQTAGKPCFPAEFVAAKPMSAFAESLRVLRSRVLLADGERASRVIALTSPLPGEGKTTTSLCLARIAALSGQKVALIDCDLRRCSLNVLLGIEPSAGIVQILSGDRDWRDLIGRDELTDAHIIPAMRESFTAADVFGGPAMKNLLEDLSRVYDLVILDCPPVLTLAEARTLASLADSCVLVARRGKTTTFAMRTALKQLDAARANVLGVAFNGVDRRAPGRMSYADPLYFSRAQKGMYST